LTKSETGRGFLFRAESANRHSSPSPWLPSDLSYREPFCVRICSDQLRLSRTWSLSAVLVLLWSFGRYPVLLGWVASWCRA